MEIYEALVIITEFLTEQAGEGSMASVKINNEGSCYLSVGVTDDRPRMNLTEFAHIVEGD